ncbi:hypothetical protein R1sor_012519 [Riccia sorocarpa]|uniref:CCHC-type domain-containing protein n=1 Tax=Riccia sorocarpa TaxID=122646 RepID=A0ABD3I403_9MARC
MTGNNVATGAPGSSTGPNQTFRQSWSNVVAGRSVRHGKEDIINTADLPNLDWTKDVQDGHIREAFNALTTRKGTQPPDDAPRTKLNMDIAKQSFGMLQKVGVILFTAEDAPSRDRVVEWVQTEIIDKRMIPVRAVRELARKHFLILLASTDQTEELLKAPPLAMGGRAVMMTKWSPEYDYREVSKAAKQIWVELQYVDPLLIAHGELMLKTLGQPLYHTIVEDNQLKYAHIRACVLRHDLQNLPETLVVDLPWGGHAVQEVKYTFLPDSCFKCRQRGHMAAQCPNPHRTPGKRNFQWNRPLQQPRPHAQPPIQTQPPASPVQTTTTEITAPEKLGQGKSLPTWRRKVEERNIGEQRHNIHTRDLQTAFDQEASKKNNAGNSHTVTTEPTAIPATTDTSTGTQLLDMQEDITLLTQQLPPDSPKDHDQWDLNQRVSTPVEEDNSKKTLLSTQETQLMGNSQPTKDVQDNAESGEILDSPIEPTIIAKKRALQGGFTSPHKELLPAGDRFEREKFSTPSALSSQNNTMFGLSNNQDLPKHWDIGQEPWRKEGAITPLQAARRNNCATELKVRDKNKLEARLKAILPNSEVVVDYTVSGRGGAALIIPAKYKIQQSGTSGVGIAAWVTVQTEVGEVNVMSIHAPNIKEDRTTMWENLNNTIAAGRWVIAGDYNMVELWDDCKGKTAVMTGAEARAWRHLADQNGLIDTYLCAASMKGGVFTQHVFCGRRYDQSKLDRIYLNQGRSWLHLVKELIHHSDQVISDHIPVTLTCYLTPQVAEDWKPKGYFKMGTEILGRPGVMDKVRQVWQEHPHDAGNPQRKWMLEWMRVRAVLKNEKKFAEEDRRNYHDIRHELKDLREEAEEGTNDCVTDRIRQLLHEVRRQEQEDARAWRLHSKSKWLRDGEAPSRYFYAQMKAKYANETMNALELQDGTVTTDRAVIKNEVQEVMTNLYKREEDNEAITQARDTAFTTVTKRITQQHDRKIHVTPTHEEIDKIAKLMKKEKSPGLDGLTIEFLLECWEFVIPTLVDVQQYGFIKGRNITGNLISLTLGADLGCPLAPYLFTLTTQVMMDMIQQQVNNGAVRGLQITTSKELVYQLYADDTGLFLQMEQNTFNSTMQTLKVFEQASGARLNLNKSLIIPLGDEQVPRWLLDTQCKVVNPSERIRYLGLLAGSDILETEICEDIKNRYYKKLNHWASKFLTWPERVLLVQTVLRTLPNYTLMAIGLSKICIKKLEGVTRDFLWGKNNAGRNKKPLVAWGTFTRRKTDGALGWPMMEEVAEAFLLKNIAKSIQDHSDDWVQIAQAFVMQTVRDSNRSREIKSWDTTWVLLGLNALKLIDSVTLNRMLKTWFKVKKKLRWKPDQGPHPRDATPTFLANALATTETVEQQEIRTFTQLCRQAKITNMSQLCDEQGRDMHFQVYCNRITHQPLTAMQTQVTDKLKFTFLRKRKRRHQAQGWQWETGEEVDALLQRYTITERQQEQLNTAKRFLTFWEEQTTRWLSGDTSRRQVPTLGARTPPSPYPDYRPMRDSINREWESEYMIRCDWENTEGNSQTDTSEARRRRKLRQRRRRQVTPDRNASNLGHIPTHTRERIHEALQAWLGDSSNTTRPNPTMLENPTTHIHETDGWITFASIEDLVTAVTTVTRHSPAA